jgi:transposase-like protein
MGVFAEFERAMIQERVRAGLRRAKERILAALKAGETIRGVADKFDVNPSTVQRLKHPSI